MRPPSGEEIIGRGARRLDLISRLAGRLHGQVVILRGSGSRQDDGSCPAPLAQVPGVERGIAANPPAADSVSRPTSPSAPGVRAVFNLAEGR
jgi:hypothetical protein